MAKTFIGGVPIKQRFKPLEDTKSFIPESITLSVDAEADIFVKVGDTVNKYTMISGALDHTPAVFSGACGRVDSITENGKTLSVVISRSNEQRKEDPLPEPESPLSELSEEALSELLLSRGVPHIKKCAKAPVALTVDCGRSGYNGTRLHICSAYPREVVGGAKIIMKLLGVRKCLFAIPSSSVSAAQKIEGQLYRGSKMLKVKLIKDKLPSCLPNLTVASVCGAEINAAKNVFDIGYPVVSPILCLAVYNALVCGIPFCEGFLSYTDGEDGAIILSLPFGTRLSSLPYDKDSQILVSAEGVFGADVSDSVSSYKTEAVRTVCEDTASKSSVSCIHCRRCSDVCPARLEPSDILSAVKRGKIDSFMRRYAAGCFECGLCTFVCPSHIQVSDIISTLRRDSGIAPFSPHPHENTEVVFDESEAESTDRPSGIDGAVSEGSDAFENDRDDTDKVDLFSIFSEDDENNESKSASSTTETVRKVAEIPSKMTEKITEEQK